VPLTLAIRGLFSDAMTESADLDISAIVRRYQTTKVG
jgi:hypothetical protein